MVVSDDTILQYFDRQPRQVQVDLVRTLRDKWSTATCHVIRAPVAAGKSDFAVAIARWVACEFGLTVTICPPTYELQRQYESGFKDLASLKGQNAYRCGLENSYRSCGAIKNKCSKCKHTAATLAATASQLRLMLPYTLLGTKGTVGYPDVLIIDEAHKLVEEQREAQTVKLWRDKHPWPRDMETHADVVQWLDNCHRVDPHKTRSAARAMLLDKDVPVLVDATQDLYAGKLKDVLKFVSLSGRKAKPTLWPPARVKVVILMSATINARDVYELGLDRFHQVAYHDCDSPILPSSRPFYVMPYVDMAYKDRALSVPELAAYIDRCASVHVDWAGFVHATYELAIQLRAYLTGPRYVWHTKDNKDQVLADFRADGGRSGRILVGSGLTEGVDLVGDIARWQVLTSIPYASMGDAATVARSELDPEFYADAAVKSLIQAYGRVCRTPTDHGATYIFDSRFKQLYDEWTYLFPPWFRDAVRWS